MFCPKCGAQLENGSVFCANCGERIGNTHNSNVQPTTKQNGTGKKQTFLQQWEELSKALDANQSFFGRWSASVTSVFALLICWNISSLIGAILAFVGCLIGFYSSNRLNKAIALVVGIITILLFFIATAL